jgi:hypothetical protein
MEVIKHPLSTTTTNYNLYFTPLRKKGKCKNKYDFPAVLQTAIFKHLKPRALPWAVASPVLRTEQKLCCYQPERLTVRQPRATPWVLFRDLLQSEGLQEKRELLKINVIKLQCIL